MALVLPAALAATVLTAAAQAAGPASAPAVVPRSPQSTWQSADGWRSDPATNTVVADRPGEQVQPKLAATRDGGFYISWFDNAAGGYDVALQRLDADGREQWPHNGIIVADLNLDWTMDYGLAVDGSDNAILAFVDDRTGRNEVTVAVVGPSATMIWGPAGIRVPRVANDVYTPSVAVSTDGYIWVAWTDGLDAKLLKLDAKGRPALAEPVTFTDADGAQLTASDVRPADDGAMIVSWVRQKGFPAPRHFYAQKISAEGRPLWGEPGEEPGTRAPVTLFDGGTLQMGNFPDFVSDGEGGAVFAWYEVEPWLVHAQWIRADGTAVFQPGGIVAADAAPGQLHTEPAFTFDKTTRSIYVFFRLTFDSGPRSQEGFVGQRLTAGGRQWGDSGKPFEGDSASEITQLTALPLAGGALIAYVEALGIGDQRLWARRVDAGGGDAWPRGRIAVSSARSGKSRLAGVRLTGGFSVFGWQDTRGGGEYADDVYVQNVRDDGTIGPPAAERFRLLLPRIDHFE